MWLLPFVAFCGAVLADRWGALGRLKVPLVIYTAVICTMAWRAAMRGQSVFIPRQTFLFGVVGACLFVVSDAILVLRRFGRRFAGGAVPRAGHVLAGAVPHRACRCAGQLPESRSDRSSRLARRFASLLRA